VASEPGLKIELAFRLGATREARGETDQALEAYGRATRGTDKSHPYRLSALARVAAIHENRREFASAIQAYRDIVRNARDQELVAAASDRATQLEAATRRSAR